MAHQRIGDELPLVVVMRAAAIAGHEAGIEILVPMHDAFWITAPIRELEGAIETMRELMTRAGRAVCGINFATEVSARAVWPQNLGDTRPTNVKRTAIMDRNPQPGDRRRAASGELKRKARLRLVTDDDPGPSVFDNLDALRRELPPVATRRARSVETFARVPHLRGYELARQKLSGSAWAVLIVLDRLILMGRGRNPVRLTRRSLEAIGRSRFTVMRALQRLVAAGVVSVEQRPGQAKRLLQDRTGTCCKIAQVPVARSHTRTPNPFSILLLS